MKKGIYLLLIISAFYFRGYSQISYSVSFNQDSLNITNETLKGIVYSKINYKNIFNTKSSVGKPELPCVTKRFIIPANMDVDQINIVSSSFQEVSLTHKILPKQSDIPTSINYVPTNVFSFDSAVYFSNNPFPANIVSKTNIGYFDGGNKIVTVTIYPVQYLPTSYKIKFYTNLNFNLTLKPSNTNNVIHKGKRKDDKSLYDNILKTMVDNPQDISAYSDTVVDNTSKTVNTTLPFYKYVIITDNSLKSSFNNFVNFKRQKGIDVGVVTTQEIYNDPTITGDRVISGGIGIFDNAGKIRQYLFEAYQSGITTWALLGGDATYVPIRIGNSSDNSTDHGDNIPTDLYFADFNGNWNVDGDLFYGENSNDSPDYLAEIFVGRILCSTAQQIANWELSPAYDLCHAYSPGSEWVSQHALSINSKRTNITKEDLMIIGASIKCKKSSEIIDQINDEVVLL